MEVTMRTCPSDYADERATEIDAGPHWSAPRPVPPRLPRALQVSAVPTAGRAVRVAPVTKIIAISHAPVRVPFYSFAEQQAAQETVASAWSGETERVDPLPFGALKPAWIVWFDRMWPKLAAPALGMIAGLIFVVGYLAYSTQARPAAHAAAGSAMIDAAPIAMEVDLPAPAPEVPLAMREPTVTAINAPAPAPAPRAKHASKKRGPIRINDATPLGDLRPGR
jgi:hypothetical protein